jgi:hypothetical protein
MWGLWGKAGAGCNMEPTDAKRHLIEAVRWSSETKTDWVEILASAIGMAAPILLGAALGKLALGVGMAVGSLLVGGTGASHDWHAQIKALVAALVPAAAATSISVAVAGQGWVSDAAVALIAGAAGPWRRWAGRSRRWRSVSFCC